MTTPTIESLAQSLLEVTKTKAPKRKVVNKTESLTQQPVSYPPVKKPKNPNKVAAGKALANRMKEKYKREIMAELEGSEKKNLTSKYSDDDSPKIYHSKKRKYEERKHKKKRYSSSSDSSSSSSGYSS